MQMLDLRITSSADSPGDSLVLYLVCPLDLSEICQTKIWLKWISWCKNLLGSSCFLLLYDWPSTRCSRHSSPACTKPIYPLPTNLGAARLFVQSGCKGKVSETPQADWVLLKPIWWLRRREEGKLPVGRRVWRLWPLESRKLKITFWFLRWKWNG